MKRVLCLLALCGTLQAATIVEPKLPEAKPNWDYLPNLGILQKDDLVTYLSGSTQDDPPWWMAIVFEVSPDEIIVMRPMGKGVAIFEAVDKKRILSAARPHKKLNLLGD